METQALVLNSLSAHGTKMGSMLVLPIPVCSLWTLLVYCCSDKQPYTNTGAGFKTPGPDHRPNSPYWGRGPEHHFGNRLKSKSAETPGPGELISMVSN